MDTAEDLSLRSTEVGLEASTSPDHKRARYSPSGWSLSSSSKVSVYAVQDLGVGRLDSDSESMDNNTNLTAQKAADRAAQSEAQNTKISEIEATLPENTLQKLCNGELDHILLKHASDSATISDNTNYFDVLSDEMVLHIFVKLPRTQLTVLKLVCSRFSRLVEDESLWTNMNVGDQTLESGAFGVIMSRQVAVLRASRTEIKYPPIHPDVKAYSTSYRCRLMYLDLSMASVSPESLEMILKRCKRIKKISLENVPVNKDVLMALSGNKDLEVINFAMSTGIDGWGLKYLLENCRKIKQLNLAWTYLDAGSIRYICENLSSSMDRLNMSGCRKLLRDSNISSLVTNCPHLRELDLSDCTALTGEAVRQIIALSDLNFLALSRCYQIPAKALLCLKKVKSLSFLDVHGGYIDANELQLIKDTLGDGIVINQFKFSSVARPTVGPKRSSIWMMRVRD